MQTLTCYLTIDPSILFLFPLGMLWMFAHWDTNLTPAYKHLSHFYKIPDFANGPISKCDFTNTYLINLAMGNPQQDTTASNAEWCSKFFRKNGHRNETLLVHISEYCHLAHTFLLR